MLTDFAAYKSWNPFVTDASGEAKEGARLRLRMQPPGARGFTFRPVVLKASPPRELRWLGRTFLPAIFDGEHSFQLLPKQSGGTHFVQSERFTGLLVPLFMMFLAKSTQAGFEALNQAIKRQAESLERGIQSQQTA